MSVKVRPGMAWGFLPARGGSKSIPLKNIAPFAGRPLIDYNILAAKAARSISRLICSTDSSEIVEHCQIMGVETHDRPAKLAGDDAPVDAVVAHLLEDLQAREGVVAEFVALLEPTSPFLLRAHIEACIAALKADPEAGSSQTVAKCPPKHHAFAQRVIKDAEVFFRFEDIRRRAYNKQRRGTHYVFGNLVVFRSVAMLAQGTVFARRSRPVIIEPPYDFDADGPADFRLGEQMLERGLVALPHLDGQG